MTVDDNANLTWDIRPGPPASEVQHMQELARSVLAVGVPGDRAYAVEFGTEDGATAFGQIGLEGEEDWCTGLFVAPDAVDLSMAEPTLSGRRDADHRRFYAELAQIGEQWHQENESFDGAHPFAQRPQREEQLRALYQRWAHFPGLTTVNTGPTRHP